MTILTSSSLIPIVRSLHFFTLSNMIFVPSSKLITLSTKKWTCAGILISIQDFLCPQSLKNHSQESYPFGTIIITVITPRSLTCLRCNEFTSFIIMIVRDPALTAHVNYSHFYFTTSGSVLDIGQVPLFTPSSFFVIDILNFEKNTFFTMHDSYPTIFKMTNIRISTIKPFNLTLSCHRRTYNFSWRVNLSFRTHLEIEHILSKQAMLSVVIVRLTAELRVHVMYMFTSALRQ